MSWFGAVPVAKISPKDAFYFLTDGRIKHEFFKLTGPDSISVYNSDIKTLPDSGKATAIPKGIIDGLNPAKHFMVKTRLTVGRSIQSFGEFALGQILTDSVWKYRNDPKFLTRAFFSCGEPCLDLGSSIVILSCDKNIPKFSDDMIWEKLTMALHKALTSFACYSWPEFTIEVPRKEGSDAEHITVTVSISLAKEVKDLMTSKHVGTFTVPKREVKETPEDGAKEN